MTEIRKIMPIVALRGMTILPDTLIHFDINRKITVNAVEMAMEQDQQVLLLMQKDPNVEDPKPEDLYSVGTVAEIKQLIKLPGDIIRVMVQGLERAEVCEIYTDQPYLYGEVEVKEATGIEDLTEVEITAYLRGIKSILEVYAIENPRLSKDIMKTMLLDEDIVHLLNAIASNIAFSYEEKQELLEINDISERYEKTCIALTNEIEILRIRKDLQAKVKEKVDKNQKEYIMREQLKIIREELGDKDSLTEAEEYLSKVKKLKASKTVKDHIEKEIERYKNLGNNSSESSVSRGYIEMLLTLPWDKVSKDNKDIKNAMKVLDEDHYGLKKVKDRIIEFLAVRSLTKKGDSPIICLVGPPGTGKTSIARSVAKALDKEYVRISLGGVRDEAEIRGHRRTYVGAMPGRIVSGLKNAGVKNPLMLLDEIDKVSNDYKGDTFSALLEVLDAEQNKRFVDHYIEQPVDLSEVLFIATANSVQTIPRPLLDRMELIEVNSYSQNEKEHIAKEHLIVKQIEKNGLNEKQLSISDKAISHIINGYTKEAGVRNLERKLGEICRKVAREILESDKKSVKITDKNLEKYLGKERYTFDEINKEDEIGIVRGLAWTSVGGDTLQIEVNVMPGKGKFELTGKLGDVMKESARAGISYIRSISSQYGIAQDFFEKNDIHIHIPEGAVPKDGPSAGITMATAMLSAITNTKVRADVAMTGEITLRGRVLPIGGLKEKILAAKAAKVKLVLVPKKNKSNIDELEKEIVTGIDIELVDTMEEVLSFALVK
ncbi:ATP-dependent Lon protease [Anaerosporobacter mobilis DSM 15930]|uniref:Lon protease n=1 Tax=Anaerosporobacter mobilis DSM 15930 TaxID=1120996 RepID=A0A1M7L898_9FIRM|nr:endopeptidase La [Anaerosporobacter mobilis]SHM73615.1 ATP-dependent Lon protease [Anaerosporobacter mobilis DSM 15930]